MQLAGVEKNFLDLNPRATGQVLEVWRIVKPIKTTEGARIAAIEFSPYLFKQSSSTSTWFGKSLFRPMDNQATVYLSKTNEKGANQIFLSELSPLDLKLEENIHKTVRQTQN